MRARLRAQPCPVWFVSGVQARSGTRPALKCVRDQGSTDPKVRARCDRGSVRIRARLSVHLPPLHKSSDFVPPTLASFVILSSPSFPDGGAICVLTA